MNYLANIMLLQTLFVFWLCYFEKVYIRSHPKCVDKSVQYNFSRIIAMKIRARYYIPGFHVMPKAAYSRKYTEMAENSIKNNTHNLKQ